MTMFVTCQAQLQLVCNKAYCIPTSTQQAIRQHRIRRFEPCQPIKSAHRRQHFHVVAARTESVDMPVGDAVPAFELIEPLTGQSVSLQQAKGSKGTLIVFMCNHCPFVIHLRDALIQLAHDVQPRGVEVLGISSNSAVTHPQDGPEKMAQDSRSYGYPFKYLYDESQDVAKAYQAACTPEFYLADGNLQLYYHGQFDGSRPSNDMPVSGEDVRAAIDSLLNQQPLDRPMRPSMGCGIKWHPGK
ncbi:hypothetical protein ABBQ32_000253 [Trebouxia sp. C0010 RCD-2024]